MTFYDLTFYGSKIAGTASGMEAVWKTIDVIDKWYKTNPDWVRNSNRCDECELTGKYEGVGPLYHNLIVREQVAREFEQAGEFVWTKRRGIGRRKPSEYLDELVSTGKEEWFSISTSEI